MTQKDIEAAHKLPAGSGTSFAWVQVWLAAAAMVGTLPGRTQGLGLVTEPLLRSFNIDRGVYAQLNLWATLIGALFALGIGRLIDRVGSRVVLTVLVLALGVVTIVMGGVTGIIALALCLTLTRGLGQGALSVASQALVGKWFTRRLNTAMAVYSILLSIGFMAAFPAVGAAVANTTWRIAWSGVGWTLALVLTPVLWLFARSSPEAAGLAPDAAPVDREAAETGSEADGETAETDDVTLPNALRTMAFWAVGLSSAAYGLVASGIGLFNESILAERGLPASVYHGSLAVTALTSLIGNFLGGWLTNARPVQWQVRLTGAAMLLFGLSLVILTRIQTAPQAYALSLLMGVAGGLVIVVFFSFWGRAYGRAHLGLIQGAAQTLTVLASAIGPLLLARMAVNGSYASAFHVLAASVAALGIWCWLTPFNLRSA